MRTVINYIFEPEEIVDLNYRLITEQSGSSYFNTGKIQRAYEERFDVHERAIIDKIKAKARRWYLVGLPNNAVEIPYEEYTLWRQFAAFLVANCTYYDRVKEGAK